MLLNEKWVLRKEYKEKIHNITDWATHSLILFFYYKFFMELSKNVVRNFFCQNMFYLYWDDKYFFFYCGIFFWKFKNVVQWSGIFMVQFIIFGINQSRPHWLLWQDIFHKDVDLNALFTPEKIFWTVS